MKRYNLIVVFLCLSFISFGQQCKGDCENGNGIYTWDDGTKYNGEWLNRQFHGSGIYSCEEYIYDGEWFEGKWHGFGTFIRDNVGKYVGEFKNGVFHGSGIYSSEEHTYDGEWVDGKQHGQGIYFWKNGDKYDGEWDDGRRHGEGTQSYHDYRIWKGIFKQGKKLKGYYNTDNYYNPDDIIGNNENCIIQLGVSDESNYNITVSFNEIDQQFIFDTGANSGFTCSTSFINKLKRAGVKIEFLKIKAQSKLADNSIVDCKYAIVDGVKIGDYTLNNFVVRYYDNGAFLLGTGTLAKFSSINLSVSSNKAALTLYK